ncbi:hypothetical protein [Alcanivorax sp. 1008]|uniref:HzsA-related protein n=1 Tax=Alcanivorax sp. 1008 TaxID=2816853 RepID=UPI001E346922
MTIRYGRSVWISVCIIFVMLFTLSGCLGDSQTGGVDPRLGEAPVAYVLRSAPLDEDGVMLVRNEREPDSFYAGGELVIREAASPSAAERRISQRIFAEPHDVKHLSPSYDGRRLLFSLRAPEIPGADDDEQPRWNIWEYDADTDEVRRIISSDLIAEEAQDLMPRYLPDGRILFVSDRQRQSRARLLDEGKPQFSPQEESRRVNGLALHVMNSDGSDIRQISFNPSHDLFPVVMNDGRLLLVRWDNNGAVNEFNLYAMRPDGGAVDILYGADSHAQEDPAPLYTNPALLEDGRLLVMKRPTESLTWSAQPLVIDFRDFINIDEPLVPGAALQAEQLLGDLPFTGDDEIAVSGRFAALTPLADGSGRLLAAWAPCRLRHPVTEELLACTDENINITDIVEAEPAYGLWIFDQVSNRQLPVVAPRDGVMVTEAVVLAARTRPPALADGVPGIDRDLVLAERGAGILNIRSVYDFAGEFDPLVELPPGVTTLAQFADPALVTAEQRSVRFLRIAKAVLLPDRDVVMVNGADIGRLAAFGMRELVGYVPVAPDGSVRVEVPANVALDVQLVDASGRRIGSQHGAWLSVRPGEEVYCGGCHEAGSPAPHGRVDAQPASINPGAPVTGSPFPNTRPQLFADAGDSMAEVLTRVEPDRLQPSVDMVFVDVWTDPVVRVPDDSMQLLYSDLQTPVPADADCIDDWTPLCRTVIDYRDHIQPLWELPRQVNIEAVTTDVTCTSCHSRRDDADMLQVPPGQLELTAEIAPESASQLVSYRELLFTDNTLELVDGALVDQLVPVLDDNGDPVFVTDEEGNLVLDQDDNPIPLQEPVQIGAPMIAGASRFGRFFPLFLTGGSHQGWLDPAELRLLAEWLDIGAQNYNDPFAVPQ